MILFYIFEIFIGISQIFHEPTFLIYRGIQVPLELVESIRIRPSDRIRCIPVSLVLERQQVGVIFSFFLNFCFQIIKFLPNIRGHVLVPDKKFV